MSVFEHFVELGKQYDCIAFRQIDQDINDFKFPASYFEATLDQSLQSNMALFNNMPAAEGKYSRECKLLHDKKLMRTLLRAFLFWGKRFKFNKKDYQFCYPTGFLKVIHRFINLMSLEDTFWIIVGIVREYPRLFCLEASTLLGESKSLYRHEFNCIRASLDVHFPKVA